ncbi:MAG: hypothetical protein LUD40_18345 [Phocaeicola dorei]|nr:hypothetical protein [Phocaeicola dorei]
MAKKIIPDGPAPIDSTGEDTTKVVDNTQVEAEAPAPANVDGPDEFVTQILRVYPTYESLYVDRHGGVYTPDTAALLRQGAILYKNPFYKSFKTK